MQLMKAYVAKTSYNQLLLHTYMLININLLVCLFETIHYDTVYKLYRESHKYFETLYVM